MSSRNAVMLPRASGSVPFSLLLYSLGCQGGQEKQTEPNKQGQKKSHGGKAKRYPGQHLRSVNAVMLPRASGNAACVITP